MSTIRTVPVTLTPDEVNNLLGMLREYSAERWNHARRTTSAAVRAHCETEGRKASDLEAELVKRLYAPAVVYRANFGDGTHTRPYPDLRDARLEKWGRAAIVQYRTSIESKTDGGDWITVEPSRASLNGPPIVEVTANGR